MRLLPYTLLICVSLVVGVPHSLNDVKRYKNFLDNINKGKFKGALPGLNRWERSGKYEGDILLSDEMKRDLLNNYMGARNAAKRSKIWRNNEVFYEIQEDGFSASNIRRIRNIIGFLGRVSCVTFTERIDEDDYILIRNSEEGCFADLGMKGGEQIMNLEALNNGQSDCMNNNSITHEFLHALGFYHMQSTFDRDDYVTINWDNIEEDEKFNFERVNRSQLTNLRYDYDYRSMLHYSDTLFSVNGLPTMTALIPGQALGPLNFPTPADFQKLNALYRCRPGEYVILNSYQ